MVQQCPKALNYISNWYDVGRYWVPGHAGVRGNKIANKLGRGSSLQKFVGPEPSLGVSGIIEEIRLSAGWINSIWQCGVVW
jgi:hypothetical protein